MANTKKPGNNVAIIEKKVTQIETAASALVITSQADLDRAGELLLLAKAGQQQAVEMFDPQREAAYQAYQVALGQLNKYKTPFINAEKTIKQKQSDYLVEQERKQREEQERLQRIAEEKAEKERQRLLKKASKAKTEEAREELEEQAETVVAHVPTISSSVTMTAGTASRMTDKPEVVNAMELIKAIASGEIKIDVDRFISFKLPVLEQYIKLTGVKKIPGVNIKRAAVISASKGGVA